MENTGQNCYTGCWTCRLRRKKCDKMRPICQGCAALEISCYSDVPKPEWMDNAVKQVEMAQRIKNEVKRSAVRRRSRKLMQRIARDLDGEEIPAPGTGSSTDPARETVDNISHGKTAYRPESPGARSPSSSTMRAAPDRCADGSPQVSPDHSTGPDWHRLAQRVDNELEFTFVMVYLDYTFPVLFPFYIPTIFDGGRSWLLVMPMKIKALYHTVIGLTSYFFSSVPISSGPASDSCVSIAAGEQRKQTDLAVKMVQRDLYTVNTRGVHCNLIESAYLLGSIVQLLIFEGVVATNENWRIHLSAAIVLFEQIVQYPGTVSSLLDLMGQASSLPARALDNTFWNSDQASFRFFSAVLLVADVISSTALEQSPRLREYHGDLLIKSHCGKEPALPLEDFFGCQSWAILLVGEIAALDAWKKDMKKHRTLTIAQLLKRASIIEEELQSRLARLDSNPDEQCRVDRPARPSDLLQTLNPPSSSHHPCPSDTTKTVTRIWAYAARMYLHIVLSGWQIATPEVRDDVIQIIELFTNLPSPASFRALAWPLCIAGCMAEKGQESAFRKIIASMGPLGMLGTMREVLGIMENVWRKRAHIDPDTWDIAACLRSSGHVVCLI
ncbi:Zn(II)2Cys6 transcription factor [Aspergillus lucknowensis]|uniref:Fungal-specific transcription factor domain-containing protein n=1 Tax=Aspergillus lucknowensis TaxID=176173 RepID=A0ABR4LQT1_9EURO